MYIYGSTAIKFWYPDFNRIPKDLDIISRDSVNANKQKTEVYWTDAFEYIEKHNKHNVYVDPDLLYTIKVSHLSWDINWTKHLKDVHFLQEKGNKLNKEFYDLLIKDWEKIHSTKKINFNKKHKELFNDGVKRKYNHDQLHEILKLNNIPMYRKILFDENRAICSEKKFKELSEKEQLEVALEEVAVISIERYVIKGVPFKYAIVKSLKDLTTRMTKGWFNLYLIENSSRIIYMDKKYYEHFKTKGETL